MTWADLIIIFVAVSLITVMRYLDTMPGYSCPNHCSVDHIHWIGIDDPIPTDESVLLECSVKPGTYHEIKSIAY